MSTLKKRKSSPKNPHQDEQLDEKKNKLAEKEKELAKKEEELAEKEKQNAGNHRRHGEFVVAKNKQ